MEYDCGFTKDDKWFRYRAAAIIIENGYVLFAGNERENYYYSIGGGVHMGETAEEAVIREVFEETGVKYDVDRLVFIHENFFEGDGILNNKRCHEVAFYFLMKSRGTRQLNSTSYTSDGIKENMYWLPIDKLNEYKAYPTFFKEKLKNIPKTIEHIITKEELS
ncbi:MAG TPA: NUDIX hydrolase [Clostridium sp.]|nr:NUDIX hydrolase [Clostridium sp.]